MPTEPVDATPGGISSLEPQVPKGDMYIFDPAKFDEEASRELRDHEAWLKRAHWRDDRARESLYEMRKDTVELREWSETYSGKVKKNWGDPEAGAWHYIVSDVEDPQVPLTDVEIDAVIDYPLWHVPTSLGEHRPLTQEQLNRLAAVKIMVRFGRFEELAEAQLRMGVEPQVVQQAAGLNSSVKEARIDLR